MKKSFKIDWFSFSFPTLDIPHVGFREWLDQCFGKREIEKAGKFHREFVQYSDGPVFQLVPRIPGHPCLCEFNGNACHKWQDNLWEFLSFFKGKLNRIDGAWDIFPAPGFPEELIASDLHEVTRGLKNCRDFSFDGEWSGCTVGYGKGSETCLRVYDKAREQGKKWIGGPWWRLEMTVRGKACKVQEWEKKISQGVLRWFMEKKACFEKVLGPVQVVGVQIPRANPTLEGRKKYWENKFEKSQVELGKIIQEGGYEVSR